MLPNKLNLDALLGFRLTRRGGGGGGEEEQMGGGEFLKLPTTFPSQTKQ